MKTFINAAFIAGLMFCTGCSDDTSNYMYQNSFDNYIEWGCNNFNTLHKGEAHSGGWCVEVDSVRIYGPSFACKMKDLPVQNPEFVRLSGWVYLPSLESSCEIIVSINEKGKDAILWKALSTEDLVDSEKEWVHMNGEFEIPSNINPEADFTVTAKCTGKDRVLIDDIAFDLD